MLIGLLDCENTGWPNLALMKISAYHKAAGDTVQRFAPWNKDIYDRVYASKIFTKTNNPHFDPSYQICGGPGFDLSVHLPDEIDAVDPDYSMYNTGCNFNFLSRGCRFNCSHCMVREHEGKVYSYRTVDQAWTDRTNKKLVIMDSDFFGNPGWRQAVEKITEYALKIAIPNGFNIRTINHAEATALRKLKTYGKDFKRTQIYFAWDRPKDESLVLKGLSILRHVDFPFSRLYAFVLVGKDSTIDEDLRRLNILFYDYKIRGIVMLFGFVTPYMAELKRWARGRMSHRPRRYGVSDFRRLHALYSEHVTYKQNHPDERY